jgi:CheY-like chemotaxis protein
MGHRVRIALDGPTALVAAQEFEPDVALIDIGLPGLNGYEVARRIREHPKLCGILLVAQTGWGQEDDRRRSREAGFDEHLVKPVDLEDLTAILDRTPASDATQGLPEDIPKS